jgi:predicted DNA-binding transcriptional regulator YafY
MNKESKNLRMLDMYVRLCEGKILNKKDEARKFGVDERSIQRDFNGIREYLADHAGETTGVREILYDRSKDGFVMTGCDGSFMSNDEILAVSKILLESRAFTKKEISTILDKLISECVPQKNMKLVSDLISNEKYHYVELHHKSTVKDKLWTLGEEIKKTNLLEIVYAKQIASKEVVTRVIQPVAIVFSEYYFYLNAFIVEKNDDGDYVKKYDYPAIFRIDRIKSYRELGEKFAIVYANRFEEGEFRKRVQFMFPGKLMRLQFKYTGRSLEAILDRLPTAKVLSENEETSLIEAEVYGNGIIMWLLSQGSSIEIVRPKEMREELKRVLIEMLSIYE